MLNLQALRTRKAYRFLKHTLRNNPVRWIKTNVLLTEMNNKMKLSVTIVLLFIASYALAQSPNRDSRSTKIDENEKKRLENQFKSLNTFYINDDGLVVYQTQGNSTIQKKEENQSDTTDNTASAPQNTKIKEDEGSYLIKEDNLETQAAPIERPMSKRVNSSAEVTKTETNYKEKAPARAGIIRKEALKPTEVLSNREPVNNNNKVEANTETEIKSLTIKNSPITFGSEEQTDNTPKAITNNTQPKTEANKTGQTKSTQKKSSVFNKNKYTSQYKTMEEAALAVEALLEDLRKEQAQTTSAGSMSSRLSGGAGRASLRKKPVTSPSYSNNTDNTSINTATVIDEETSEFGNEPTYFINGKEVDKIEVNRLRKKEIINKEVRTRNTVSGNPNGEVWYEVKYDN